MDPALRKERETFKKRAAAAIEKSKKSKEVTAKASVTSTQIKKARKHAAVNESPGKITASR